MAELTKIQWTDHTFNPWIGCTKVHTGCLNCYAEADMDKRRGRAKWGPNGTRSRTSDAYWREPLKWNREAAKDGVRRRVFCASLADVFEDWQGSIVASNGSVCYWCERCGERTAGLTPKACLCGHALRPATMNDLREVLFGLIDKTPNIDWLLLTKRPENIRRMLLNCAGNGRKNIWLGTSVSDQGTADKAVPELLKCRDLAPVLFLSVEPLVGPVDLGPWLGPWTCNGEAGVGKHDGKTGPTSYCGSICRDRGSPLGPVDWVIIGGESGPNARPCNPTWVKDIVDQCRATGVACFVKQIGSNVLDFSGAVKDKKGGDMGEWPDELRVREWPEVIQAI